MGLAPVVNMRLDTCISTAILIADQDVTLSHSPELEVRGHGERVKPRRAGAVGQPRWRDSPLGLYAVRRVGRIHVECGIQW